MDTTKLSSKGQVVLPKSLRDAAGWRTGTEFVVEKREDGILLRPVKPFRATRFEDVAGCLAFHGKPKTIKEMDLGIAEAVRERNARGRH